MEIALVTAISMVRQENVVHGYQVVLAALFDEKIIISNPRVNRFLFQLPPMVKICWLALGAWGSKVASGTDVP